MSSARCVVQTSTQKKRVLESFQIPSLLFMSNIVGKRTSSKFLPSYSCSEKEA